MVTRLSERELSHCSKTIRSLLTTDVVARGIDEESHVINYDLPGTYEDYIHPGRPGMQIRSVRQ